MLEVGHELSHDCRRASGGSSAGSPPERGPCCGTTFRGELGGSARGCRAGHADHLVRWRGRLYRCRDHRRATQGHRQKQAADEGSRGGDCGVDRAVTWRELEGDPGRAVAQAAHTADLVITTRDQAASSEIAGLAPTLVTTAGLPVLVLPPSYVDDGGRSALVGWDGSREATRAVHAALRFLQQVKTTVLCTIGEQAAESLDEATTMLQRHGMRVRAERMPSGDSEAGPKLLTCAAAHGAEMLVM